MAYITTERVAEIRAELKKALPDFKFSVVREHGSGVCISIMAGPAEFPDMEYNGRSINHYHASQYGDNADLIKQIYAIAAKGVTHYETADYGSQPSHYVWMHLGKFDKPYVCTKKLATA